MKSCQQTISNRTIKKQQRKKCKYERTMNAILKTLGIK